VASTTELIRKHDQKREEFSEWNIRVEKKKGELAELDKKYQTLQGEYDSIIQKIESGFAELSAKQQAFDASVDRSHLAFAYSVEELSDQAVKLKDELAVVSARKNSLVTEIAQLERDKTRLLSEISRIEKQANKAIERFDKTTIQLTAIQNKLAVAKLQLSQTKETNAQVVKDTAYFGAKQRHLDLMEKRIRNYYKKVGLIFRPYK
jgi:chromosome segregation ATPase